MLYQQQQYETAHFTKTDDPKKTLNIPKLLLHGRIHKC